jgi:hypothetical protein
MMVSLIPDITYGQSGANGTQVWLDRENNMKILFSTTPAQPIISTPSELKFTVQNLQTSKPVTNLLAGVDIFGGTSSEESAFRLTNISAPNGQFSVNVIFPEIRPYQVITRITSQNHNVSLLASFITNASAPQSTLSPFSGNYIIGISLLVAAAAGIGSFLILRDRTKKD